MRTSFVLAGLLVAATQAAAFVEPELITGEKLLLGKKRVTVASSDASITLGRGPGSADDPVMHGGKVRVLSIEGDVFDGTYDMPASGWKSVKKKGAVVGYKFHGKGFVQSALVRAGKLVRLALGGGALRHTIVTDPKPVRVVLTLGEQQLCMEFGGDTSFKSGKRWVATDAPAPTSCPLPYGEDSAWLCRPGMTNDQCLANDLDATRVAPDLTTSLEPQTGSQDHPYDCFYVYPTVDLSGPPGNHEDVTDPAYVALTLDPLVSQAARFDSLCRVFAPHYRQITFSTFGSADGAFLEKAYHDVLDAWRLYLKYDNGGRNVVIMGHSQGTFMTTRLMQEEVDPDADLRSRLIVALLIGGSVGVPQGQLVGGTFTNIPLCHTNDETGCVIAYRSYADGFPPAAGSNSGPGALDTACTNPAALGGGPALLSKTYFPTHTNQPLFQIAPDPGFGTPFVLFESFYTAECVKDATNHSYLKITPTPGVGDLRTNPIPFGSPVLSPALLGTHILDYNWTTGNLLGLVATKAANMP
jgi:pimeloyl-ACP methyl ester carboxylesterase